MTLDDFFKKRKALRHFREIERGARPWQSRRAYSPDPQYWVEGHRPPEGDPQYKTPASRSTYSGLPTSVRRFGMI